MRLPCGDSNVCIGRIDLSGGGILISSFIEIGFRGIQPPVGPHFHIASGNIHLLVIGILIGYFYQQIGDRI
ncbi:MAG: hypothetical protein AAF600_21580 [Bacteroidota bacterium]